MKHVFDLSVTSRPYRTAQLSSEGPPPPPPPGPVAIFDFTSSLPAEFSLTRASEGTYVDAGGALQIAPADTPRIDHDLMTFASLGLLVEAAGGNQLPYGREMDNAAWLKSNVTITADAHAAPDGTSSADLLNPGGGTTQCRQHATVTENTNYTLSYYALEPSSGGNGIASIRAYDISNGSEIISHKTIPITPGWGRVQVTFITPPGCVELWVNTMYKSYGNYYVWGGQLEVGVQATSYIPIDASPVSRAADVVQYVGADLGTRDVIVVYDDDSEGVLLGQSVAAGWWPALSRPRIKQILAYPVGGIPV